jgi:nucleoside-diphosphate-sugar epimerase
MAKSVFIIGAGGFVGSAVSKLLRARGYRVSGLARSKEAADRLESAGYGAEEGDLQDLERLSEIADRYDVTIFTPTIQFDEEAGVLTPLLDRYAGSGRVFIFTSGTGVLSIPARNGEWREETFAEDDPFTPVEWMAIRVNTENLVRSYSERSVRAMVIRPPLIWGHGGSYQIPGIFDSVEKTGAACYLGLGLHLYSNVHVDDLADVYLKAIERGVAGALYHAVAGEANFRQIAEAVAEVMGCEARSVDMEEAAEIWGPVIARLLFGVSSRSRAVRSRMDLDWSPRHLDVIDDIRKGSYKEKYSPAG